MSHQMRPAEAKKVKSGLLVEDELNAKKLWGDNISGLNWTNRVHNICTMETTKKLHECTYCARAPFGFCGERFMVKSSGGRGTHTFTAGYNKDFQRARLKGTSGLPQPKVPTEEQWELMQLQGLFSVHELEVFLMNQAEAEDPVDEESDENDQQPWEKYEKTGYKSKAPPRPKTKTTQGVKHQPVPTVKEIIKETEKLKETENRYGKETRTEIRSANGAISLTIERDPRTESSRTVDKTRVVEKYTSAKPKTNRAAQVIASEHANVEEKLAQKADKKAAKKAAKEEKRAQQEPE